MRVNDINKFIILLLVVFLLMEIVPVNASAYFSSQHVSAVAEVSGAYAQQTQWVYRTYEGRRQMRLWSITEGRWLTDWIGCD